MLLALLPVVLVLLLAQARGVAGGLHDLFATRTDFTGRDSLQLLQLGASLLTEQLAESIKGKATSQEPLSLLSLSSSASVQAALLAVIAQTAHRASDLKFPELTIAPWPRPWDHGAKALASCTGYGADATESDSTSGDEANLRAAVQNFCSAGLARQVEFFVDPKFESNYRNFVSPSGWMDEAFVTYVGLRGKNFARLAAEVDLLVQSVHHFSDRPVIVTNFGAYLPKEWTPERFPRMVLMQGRDVPLGKSFNFNKLKAMLFTKVRTGIVLDADQWINNGTDYMFRRAREEGGAAHPFPILPVHWMSRDPESSDMSGYPAHYAWKWRPDAEADGVPVRTTRWGHAHPTWTHEALPFLAKWTTFALGDPRDNSTGAPKWLRLHMMHGLEDEDLLNVALWAENQTKQWCKFDIPGMSDFQRYTSHSSEKTLFPDSKWYPRGIPLVFFTAHDAKNSTVSFAWLSKLWSLSGESMPILYQGRWFSSGRELAAFDPSLRCVA